MRDHMKTINDILSHKVLIMIMIITQNFIVWLLILFFINNIVFGDGTTLEKSFIFYQRSIHKLVIGSIARNQLKIFVGKDDFGYPPFKGLIADLRFYYENALEFKEIVGILNSKFTTYYSKILNFLIIFSSAWTNLVI